MAITWQYRIEIRYLEDYNQATELISYLDEAVFVPQLDYDSDKKMITIDGEIKLEGPPEETHNLWKTILNRPITTRWRNMDIAQPWDEEFEDEIENIEDIKDVLENP